MKTGQAFLGVVFLLIFAFVIWCVIQRRNDRPKVFYRKRLPGNYNGFAAYPVGIFMKESERENAALLAHELVHWKQFQREGFLPFLFRYSRAAKHVGYDLNPYEIEARSNETEYCRTNYTECVRTGQSQTVNNSNFRKGAF